jgi:hypothetical protein
MARRVPPETGNPQLPVITTDARLPPGDVTEGLGRQFEPPFIDQGSVERIAACPDLPRGVMQFIFS